MPIAAVDRSGAFLRDRVRMRSHGSASVLFEKMREMLSLLARLRTPLENGPIYFVAVCSWLALVLIMTVLNETGTVRATSLASDPNRVRAGKVWLLVSNGIFVQRPIILSFVALAVLAYAAMFVCGARISCLAALIGHVGSTLLAYGVYGIVHLSNAHAFSALGSRPDYGVSAVTAAWLGAVAITAWERRGHTLRGGLAAATSSVAVGLFAWMLHRHVTVIDSDHLFAFAIGASLAHLTRNARERIKAAPVKRASVNASPEH